MFGIDDIVGGVLQIGTKVIDRVFPDPAQAAAAKLELLKMQQSGELARLTAETDLAKGQLEVNKLEAGNANLFVSGWRPGVGWVCVVALASEFVVAPYVEYGAKLAGHIVVFPKLDMGDMMTLLLGMLGLGAMRTTEKLKGVAK